MRAIAPQTRRRARASFMSRARASFMSRAHASFVLRVHASFVLRVHALATTALIACAAAATAQAGEPATLPEVSVEADRIATPQIDTLDPTASTRAPPRDAGELLRAVPGVSAGRMGGHGVDPSIRGQDGNQLNIIDDGAFSFGGCPNRMDPPASMVRAETYDRITVTKGYASVLNGPGASGGTVRFERRPPRFADGQWWKASSGAGYGSNGAMRDAYVDAAAGGAAGYVRADGHWKDSGNYEDGGGRDVRSAFTQFGGAVETGWTPKDALLSLGLQRNKTEDALFAGASMDAPLDETDTVRLKAEKRALSFGPVSALKGEAFASLNDHVMDNFSLRPNTAASKMLTDAQSDTWGGKVTADVEAGHGTAVVGAEALVNNRDARRYMATSNQNVIQAGNLESLMWPDVTIGQYGLFGEATASLTAASQLKVGLRYDHVRVDYGAADTATAKNTGTYQTANQLYQAYYGRRADDETENNVGGLVRYEHEVGPATLFAGLSRAVRTADATERGLASKSTGATSKAWVGNPGIDPEAHHQLDLGATARGKDWSGGANLFYDHVADFILRDSARGQSGIRMTDQATIYRNVEARLAGFEVEGSWRFAGPWTVAADAAYTHATNLDDNSAIAQIAPLNGSLSLAYAPETWSVGARMRWAATQTRTDLSTADGSGQDAAKTSGYAVFDLFAHWRVVEGLELAAGITNLLDHSYAEHLNRPSTFDTTVSQVNEPGRSFNLRATATF